MSQMDPAHGPPLQARVAAAYGIVLAACKHVSMNIRSWRTWKEQGKAKQNDWTGARTLRRAVGMAGKGWQQAQSPQNKTTAGGHSQRILRPAQASKQTATSWLASQQKHNSCQTMSACL